MEEYVKVLKKEIEENAKKNQAYEITTIYIGGGTPSYIDSKYIVEILNTVRKNYKVRKEAEVTIEVNPGTVTEEKLNTYIRSRNK